VLGSGDSIVPDDLPAELFSSGGPAATSSLDYHQTLERTKRELIAQAFEQAGRNHTQAARLLGVHPNYLHRLLSTLDLRTRIGAR
jgi:DNA-binding NtrC family response regulator